MFGILLLVVSQCYFGYFLDLLFARLSETEEHKYLMAVCSVMSQGVRNKAGKKVGIQIVNYRGQNKT